jgi:hypothetical protein
MIIYIDAGLDLVSKSIFSHRNTVVFDRFNLVQNREGNKPLSNVDLVKFFRKAIDGILDYNGEYPDNFQTDNEYIVFSRSLMQGMLIQWNEEYVAGKQAEYSFNSRASRCIEILKFLPRISWQNEISFIVNESAGFPEPYSDELLKYIDSLMEFYDLKGVIDPENIIYAYNPAEIPIEHSRWHDDWKIVFVQNVLETFYPWHILEIY